MESPQAADDFAEQAKLLCEVCMEEARATGCTLFLQPGVYESGFRCAGQAGRSADETGPGAIKDLLSRSWDSGEPCEGISGGYCVLAHPVWPGHGGGGALIVVWERRTAPSQGERELVSVAALAASLMAPRFSGENALKQANNELQSLKGKMDEESPLVGIGRLSSCVAQELSTPLSAVLTMVDGLASSVNDPVGGRRLKIIRRAVEKCRDILERLLSYSNGATQSKGDVSFSQFVRASTDINRVIESSLEILRDSIDELNIKVHFNMGKLPEVRVNSSQWTQVFASLLSHAKDGFIEARTSQPEINIASKVLNNRICVEFQDNGPGVPPEDQPHVFEPFYSADGMGAGSGLGLVLARDVVTKHKGTIELKSVYGQGTTFIINLPLDEV